METIFWDIRKQAPQEENASIQNRQAVEDSAFLNMEHAAELIRSGELVAFPTETVYGLGADAFSATAVRKIFQAKGRPGDNPLIVHVASIEQAAEVAEVNETALSLMRAFWPGPLTLIMPRRPVIPDAVTAGMSTVAVRMPAHPVALSLIKTSHRPIAAPSANLSGRPSPTTGRHVYNDLKGRIAMVIEDGPLAVGLESTVLDITVTPPVILRPGAIGLKELAPWQAVFNDKLTDGAAAPKAPGMKYRHYAPRGKVILCEAEQIPLLWQEIKGKGLPAMALVSSERAEGLAGEVYDLGSENDLAQVARSLFAGLRHADDVGAALILAQSFPAEGIGAAIMNRLCKAAGAGKELKV